MAFGDALELDTALFELRRDGRRVPMEPQAFDVLTYLVAHRDRVVSKEELMDAIWGGRFVTEAALTSRIKQVRRAVGDDGHAQQLIRTVHGRGYRFVAPLRDEGATGSTNRQLVHNRLPVPRHRSATPSATVCTSPTRSPGQVTATSS